MSSSQKNQNQEHLKERLLQLLNEENPISFEEISSQIENEDEKELREALLDLLDKNRVIANADWEYRERTVEV